MKFACISLRLSLVILIGTRMITDQSLFDNPYEPSKDTAQITESDFASASDSGVKL